MTEQILTVLEITRRIKSALEQNFSDVWIRGEISNLKLHSSGHMYFTLKDESAQISAVMWRARVQQLLFRPADGMKVSVHGSITVYEPRGNYQIDCWQLHPLGVGELQVAFEKLKQKLLAEGLFSEERKRPLPLFPERVGIVASPTGAAIRDMLTVLSRRYPALEVVIAPVKVQGIGAAEEIVQAIEELNAIGGIDVIIVGRGGGSLEDLWAFNEEILARAIAASKIPIVSAVGHEIDFTISDFVADLRAPTPSAAAELIVRDRTELITSIRNYYDAISGDIVAYIVRYHDRLQGFMRSYALNMPLEMLKQRNQQTDDLVHRLGLSIQQYASMVRQHLTSLGQRLESLSPTNVLRRGYAIVTKGDTVITAARSLRPDEVIGVRFYRGTAEAIIKNVEGT